MLIFVNLVSHNQLPMNKFSRLNDKVWKGGAPGGGFLESRIHYINCQLCILIYVLVLWTYLAQGWDNWSVERIYSKTPKYLCKSLHRAKVQ